MSALIKHIGSPLGSRGGIRSVSGGGGGFGAPTTIFTQGVWVDDFGALGGYTLRTIQQVSGGAQTQIRLTLQASGAIGTLLCDHVAIGKALDSSSGDTTGAPTELLFSGVSGCSIAQGTTQASDWVNFGGFATNDYLVVILDENASSGGMKYGGGGNSVYKAATASYNVTTVSGSSYNVFGSTNFASLLTIETR